MSLYCDRNMNDVILTRKIPENTQLHLVFLLGIFLVEITSFMFLSQHRDTQAILCLLNIDYLLTEYEVCTGKYFSEVFIQTALQRSKVCAKRPKGKCFPIQTD